MQAQPHSAQPSAEGMPHILKLGPSLAAGLDTLLPQTHADPGISVRFSITSSCDRPAISRQLSQELWPLGRSGGTRMDHQEKSTPAPHKPGGDGRVWSQPGERGHGGPSAGWWFTTTKANGGPGVWEVGKGCIQGRS